MSIEASTEASSIESLEDFKDVIVTVNYVDTHDKQIAESKELSITDTFDIKKGKAIARARAEIKARNIFNNILRKYISDYEKELIALKVTLSNNIFYNQHDKDYIKSLVDNGN
jgi:hypothetical protein